MVESVSTEGDLVMKEKVSTSKQTQGEVKTKTLDKHDHHWELSRALAVLASASVRIGSKLFLIFPDFVCTGECLDLFFCLINFQSVSREREEFLRLVRKEVCRF